MNIANWLGWRTETLLPDHTTTLEWTPSDAFPNPILPYWFLFDSLQIFLVKANTMNVDTRLWLCTGSGIRPEVNQKIFHCATYYQVKTLLTSNSLFGIHKTPIGGFICLWISRWHWSSRLSTSGYHGISSVDCLHSTSGDTLSWHLIKCEEGGKNNTWHIRIRNSQWFSENKGVRIVLDVYIKQLWDFPLRFHIGNIGVGLFVLFLPFTAATIINEATSDWAITQKDNWGKVLLVHPSSLELSQNERRLIELINFEIASPATITLKTFGYLRSDISLKI